MTEERYSKLLKRIRDTRADEIDCSACLDQVSLYVDLELAQQGAAQRLPLVRQHLDQCSVCFEEYTLLRALARLEQGGDSPSIDALAQQLLE